MTRFWIHDIRIDTSREYIPHKLIGAAQGARICVKVRGPLEELGNVAPVLHPDLSKAAPIVSAVLESVGAAAVADLGWLDILSGPGSRTLWKRSST